MSNFTSFALIILVGFTGLTACAPEVEAPQCRYQVDPEAEPYVDPETDQIVQPETYWGPCTQGEDQQGEDQEGGQPLPECDHLVNPHFAEPGVDCQNTEEETTEE